MPSFSPLEVRLWPPELARAKAERAAGFQGLTSQAAGTIFGNKRIPRELRGCYCAAETD